MKVEGLFHVKGRGDVVIVTNAVEVRHKGAQLRRTRDGAAWTIRGVERFVNRLNRETLGVGENIGLLMPAGHDVAKGDDVEIVEAPENEGGEPR